MHHVGIPWHTLSMIVYKILSEYFCVFPVKNWIVGMLLTGPINVIFFSFLMYVSSSSGYIDWSETEISDAV